MSSRASKANWGTALVEKLVRDGRLPPDALDRKSAPIGAAHAAAPPPPAPRPRMNKTETRMAMILEARRVGGEIRDWKFEAVKLRLADRTYYTPDFLVVEPDRSLGFIEVKGGFTREDAWIKLKVAAEQHPYYSFTLAIYRRGGWSMSSVPRGVGPGVGDFGATRG